MSVEHADVGQAVCAYGMHMLFGKDLGMCLLGHVQ